MRKQTLNIEIDWDIPKRDEKLFEQMQQAILNDAIRSFNGVIQAKVEGDKKTFFTIFNADKLKKPNAKSRRVIS